MASAHGETPLGLASHIVNIAGVFTRKTTLKVPRYQRLYTWSEREVRRLIQDLRRAFERRASFYFIGQIVLVKSAQNKLEISDGQQRLATLTMLFAYVRDRLPHRANHYQTLIMRSEGAGQPRLLLRDDDTGFFRAFVQEPGQMAAMAVHGDTGSESKDMLCNAARTIAAELNELTDRELDSFMSYVTRSTTLNVVDADERGSAATVYFALNDRGIALSAADNIKCDLLENSRLKPGEADAAAQKWEELEDALGRGHFAELLNMMPYLLTGEQVVSPGDLAAFREHVEIAGGVHAFLFDQLPRYSLALRDILKGSIDVGAASADVNRRVKMMQQLDEVNWYPPAITFLAEYRGQPEKARRFFQALERFAFGCELSVIENKVREKRFARAARLANDEKAYLPKGPLDLSDGERLDFIERLNRSSKRDRLRRLILIRIEAALPGGSILTLRDDVTVEHLLPKANVQWWSDRFPDKRRRDDLCHLIGNQILITHRQNEAADTRPYPQKREIYFNTPGAKIYAITRTIETVQEWTQDVIGARQEELVRHLAMDWDLMPTAGS